MIRILASLCFLLINSQIGFCEKLAKLPKIRVLPIQLTKMLCAEHLDRETFWKSQIYDAQIEGLLVRTSAKGMISESELGNRAQTFANSLGYGSYSFGVCTKNFGWIVAFPSPEGLAFDQKTGNVKVSGKDFCDGSLSMRSVASTGGASKVVPERNGIYKLNRDLAETASIECLPKNKWAKGPEEWFLFPTSRVSVPLTVVSLVPSPSQASEFLAWVSAIREREGLRAVTDDPRLNVEAAKLHNGGSVRHDIKKLVALKYRIAKNGFRFVGEDRVSAKTIEEAMTLLWISPRHRDLLLDKNVDSVGINLKKTSDEIFIGVVGAEIQKKVSEKKSRNGSRRQ